VSIGCDLIRTRVADVFLALQARPILQRQLETWRCTHESSEFVLTIQAAPANKCLQFWKYWYKKQLLPVQYGLPGKDRMVMVGVGRQWHVKLMARLIWTRSRHFDGISSLTSWSRTDDLSLTRLGIHNISTTIITRSRCFQNRDPFPERGESRRYLSASP